MPTGFSLFAATTLCAAGSLALLAPPSPHVRSGQSVEAAKPPVAERVFKVRRWKGGLGELTVSSSGLWYRELDRPDNDFRAECRDIQRLGVRDLRGFPLMVYVDLKHRFSEAFELRERLEREKQRAQLATLHEAIADACGILIRQ